MHQGGAEALSAATTTPGRHARAFLITGGSSGIGLAAARALVRRGDRVVLMSRSDVALERARASLPVQDAVRTSVGDVRSQDDVVRAAEVADAAFGGLDGVVHSAQVMAYGRIEDVPADELDAVVTTALSGTATVARVLLPRLRARGRGAIVIVNSVLGEVAVPRLGAYCSAKAGQLALARALQLEVRDAPGVDVSIVSPGSTDTPIYAQAANVVGQDGHPPPPVLAPSRVAKTIVTRLDRPRRLTEAHPTNALIKFGYRMLPAVFDRIVGPLVDLVVFRGRSVPHTSGNVLSALPSAEAERGAYSWRGTRSASTGTEQKP